jgi:hypothetical protein
MLSPPIDPSKPDARLQASSSNSLATTAEGRVSDVVAKIVGLVECVRMDFNNAIPVLAA